MSENEMEAGVQPLDALLTERGLDNHAVVAGSTEQLTHKQVQKARKGRKLTARMQKKILAAVNAVKGEAEEVEMAALFNYRGR